MAGYKLYFAYGSDLNQTLMKKICPGSFVWARGRIEKYVFRYGQRKSGPGLFLEYVANILPDPDPDKTDFVDGVIYKVTDNDIRRLDQTKHQVHQQKKRVKKKALAYLNGEIWEVDVITYLIYPRSFRVTGQTQYTGLSPNNEKYYKKIENAYKMLDLQKTLAFSDSTYEPRLRHHSFRGRTAGGGRSRGRRRR